MAIQDDKGIQGDSGIQDDGAVTFEERRLVDRFQTLLIDTRRKATAAADGRVVDVVEGIFLDQGRELLRQAIETEVQFQADLAEKKGRAPARNAATRGGTRAREREI